MDIRAGNRAAVMKVFNKLEDAIVDTPLDPEVICTLLEAVEKKKKTLDNIDEQILHTMDSEGITDEIIETDEYYLELENQNPADYLTCGITAKQLMNSALWIKGPKWIANKAEWPNWTRNVANCNIFSTVTEESMDAEIHVPKTSCIQIEKYSSLLNWLE
ncbi:unnamed protein product [Mytilus edulis]|uniref:Uncharacterized protein n=1 Tax=Mytilus edulis TaxID=6550 RepID=A0A8S3SAG3_MYTED|nr:unnamed protein product [Mytilus edulis]